MDGRWFFKGRPTSFFEFWPAWVMTSAAVVAAVSSLSKSEPAVDREPGNSDIRDGRGED